MSTSEPYPLYNALRGTLSFEVNFTGRAYPCQKCLWGRSGCSVKFTFRSDPLQKAFWGTLVSKVNFTGRSPPPPEVPQRLVGDTAHAQGVCVKFSFNVTLRLSLGRGGIIRGNYYFCV